MSDTIRLEQLVIERAKLRADENALNERVKELDTLIGAELDTGTHQVGDYKVAITNPQRINNAKVAAAFPVATHPHLYKPAIDTAAVKHHLAPAELAKYQTAGGKQVRIS